MIIINVENSHIFHVGTVTHFIFQDSLMNRTIRRIEINYKCLHSHFLSF